MAGQTAQHYYVAEAWSPRQVALPAGTYPLQLPDHIAVTAATPGEALAKARELQLLRRWQER